MNEKMKKIAIIVIVITILLLSTALSKEMYGVERESIDNGEWYREFGGNSYEEAKDIIQTEDGGFIITGGTKSYGDGDWDVWLIKTDKNGNEIWNKTYGGEKEDIGESVIETAGGFVIGGYTHSYGVGEADFWLVKTDDDGNEIWNKTFGGVADDFALKAIQTRDEGYAMVGQTYSFGSLQDTDIWVVNMDENGNMLWSKTLGGNESDSGNDIIEMDEGYLISGITYSYATHGGRDTWLVKIDKNGNEIWNKAYGWWEFEMNALIVEAEDGYLIVGRTASTSTGWGDGYLIKIDKKGNEIWNKTYGGKDADSVWDIKRIKDGYILAGSTESYDVGVFDAWLIKIDEEGSEIWNRSFGGRDRDVANAVAVTKNGHYVIAGGTGQYLKHGNAFIAKCTDYPPPKIKMTRPRENYLYLFDREIMPAKRTLILGGITVVVEVNDSMEKMSGVEFYLCHIDHKFEFHPRTVVYSPPYEWKWSNFAVGDYSITAAARYGNARANVAKEKEVYIFNLGASSSIVSPL